MGKVYRTVVFFFVLVASSYAIAGKLTDSKRAELRSRFEVGTKYYNLREYEKALEEFRAVYLLSGEASLLFNIGQCERQLNRYGDARKSFMAYLREAGPDVAQTNEVKELIAGLDRAIKADEDARAAAAIKETPSNPNPPEDQASPKMSPPADAPEPRVSAAMPSGMPTKSRKPKWVWGLVAGSVIVIGVGLGVGLGLGLSREQYPAPTDGKINGN